MICSVFHSFPEFIEALPPRPSGGALLRPDQNEPAEHAVLRERGDAPPTSRGHDRGRVWLPVTATSASKPP